MYIYGTGDWTRTSTDKIREILSLLPDPAALPACMYKYLIMRISELFESDNNSVLTLYHGSNAEFSEFDQSRAKIVNDLYGGGIAYFTDSVSVAQSYARTMTKARGGTPVLYKVNLRLGQVFDVDDTFSGPELMEFVKHAASKDAFLRGARLLSLGTDKYKVLHQLEAGEITLTGDQVFRGLSGGMINTAVVRKILQKMGYDTLRYTGGLIMGQEQHNVYLAYYADNIEILDQSPM